MCGFLCALFGGVGLSLSTLGQVGFVSEGCIILFFPPFLFRYIFFFFFANGVVFMFVGFVTHVHVLFDSEGGSGERELCACVLRLVFACVGAGMIRSYFCFVRMQCSCSIQTSYHSFVCGPRVTMQRVFGPWCPHRRLSSCLCNHSERGCLCSHACSRIVQVN